MWYPPVVIHIGHPQTLLKPRSSLFLHWIPHISLHKPRQRVLKSHQCQNNEARKSPKWLWLVKHIDPNYTSHIIVYACGIHIPWWHFRDMTWRCWRQRTVESYGKLHVTMTQGWLDTWLFNTVSLWMSPAVNLICQHIIYTFDNIMNTSSFNSTLCCYYFRNYKSHYSYHKCTFLK